MRDCEGTCNGTVGVDICGVCNGPGVRHDLGFCGKNWHKDSDGFGKCNLVKDCFGNCNFTADDPNRPVDLGCGCGKPGKLDEHCDCFKNYNDCRGVCGGDTVVDECGICGGPGILWE